MELAYCGDLAVDPGEVCDDGNAVSGDGCAGNCRTLACADGDLDPGEECDDSNLADGDGCDGACQLEYCDVAGASFGGGTGFPGSPYQIATIVELDSIRDHDACHFVLVGPIDLTSVGFQPIPSLRGSLDGDFYTISNWTHVATAGQLGFFVEIAATGVVRDLVLADAALSEYYGNGILVAFNHGLVSQVATTGTNTGNGLTAGLAGVNYGTIERSLTLVDVASGYGDGGLVSTNSGSIIDSYAAGSVTSTASAGGLAASNPGTITRSYAAAVVTSPAPGGLVEYEDPSTGSTTSSYWDLEIGGVSSAAGTGVTHAELGDLATFSGWDFATVWQLDGATRPYLRWYPLPVAPVCGDALLDFVEACDDGNTIDGDGCAADCLSF